jgi:hypothetical protein
LKFHSGVVRYLFILYFYSSWLEVNGQMIGAATPAYFSRLNGYSQNFADVFSITGNPAAAVLLDTPAFGVAVESRFMLSELNQYLLTGIYPTKLGGFGFQLHYFGYAGYRNIEPAIAYARKLGVADLGIKFSYRLVSIPGYGNRASIIPELGALWHLSDKVHTGFKIYHPFSNLGKTGASERFGYNYSAALGYEVSPLVFLGISISKEEEREAEIATGLQYQFEKQFFAAIGISSPDAQARLGTGWRWQSLRVEITASWHFRLGITPGFLLIYQPMKTSK